MKLTTCRSKNCGAEVFWARTHNGKAILMDSEPTSAGEWMIEGDPEATPIHVSRAARNYPGDKYTVHWSTCPDAKDFRK